MFREFFRARISAGSMPYIDSWTERMFDRVAWAWSSSAFTGELMTRFGLQLMAIEQTEELLPSALPDNADPDGYAHAWVALLADNHRLAPALQLSAADLASPRKLLAGYFLKVGDFQHAVKELLATVEQRFDAGQFAQANALLQMFETDQATRRNNERNLFYESMLASFTSQRGSRSVRKANWNNELKARRESPWAVAQHWVDLWAGHAGVQFHCLRSTPTTSEPWSRVAAELTDDQRRDLLTRLAAPAMRPLAGSIDPGDLQLHLLNHVACASLSEYLERITLAAYFHTLSTGRTGYENFILEYHEWVGSRFDTIPTRILPTIHRESLEPDRLLSTTVAEQVDALIDRPTRALIVPEPSLVEPALRRINDQMRDVNPASIPEGQYDLGGLVLDEILGLNQSPLHQRIRMHRLL
jgi:hypothetical protein